MMLDQLKAETPSRWFSI